MYLVSSSSIWNFTNILWCKHCREKYSACNPNKTSAVTYDNLQDMAHILVASQSILPLVWVNIMLSINFGTENKTLYLYMLIHVIYTWILVSLYIHLCTLACTCVNVNMYIYMDTYIHAPAQSPIWIHIFMRQWGIVCTVWSFIQVRLIHTDWHIVFHYTCSVRYCH